MPEILPIRPPRQTQADRVFPFTVNRITDYECPAGESRVWLRDERHPDLRLQVTRNGAKTFYIYKKLHGKPVRIQIGPFPTVSIDDARKKAKELIGDMVKGNDPRAAKREARHGLTFGDMKNDYIEMYAKPRKKSWEEDERQFKTYLSSWNSRLLSEIKREHVATLHAKIGRENGHYVANRVLALLSMLFTFADRQRGWKGSNPCKGVQRFKEEERERFLQPNELPKFFESVNAEPSQNIRDFIFVALLTGARKMNVMMMRWENIDLDAAIWTIPKDESKSDKSMTLPLVPAVVEILRSRQGNGSEYVFPGRHGRGHLKDPMGAWRNILKRAGIENLRIHDLRRTFGSFQAGAGISLPLIGKSLGHSSPEATAIYSRLHLDPVRAAVGIATDAILNAAAKKTDERKDGGE